MGVDASTIGAWELGKWTIKSNHLKSIEKDNTTMI